MNEIRKSALVAHSSERIFDLIEAAEHYPEFLPWCAAAMILARNEDMVSARITIDFHGLTAAPRVPPTCRRLPPDLSLFPSAIGLQSP